MYHSIPLKETLSSRLSMQPSSRDAFRWQLRMLCSVLIELLSFEQKYLRLFTLMPGSIFFVKVIAQILPPSLIHLGLVNFPYWRDVVVFRRLMVDWVTSKILLFSWGSQLGSVTWPVASVCSSCNLANPNAWSIEVGPNIWTTGWISSFSPLMKQLTKKSSGSRLVQFANSSKHS